MAMTAGLTRKQDSLDGIVWNILGQTYVPKQHSENSLSWHATFPADTFVPPHIHPTQDEFVYVLDGTLEFWLDGRDMRAVAGDLARLPMGIAHGIFNRSGQTTTCLFWVSPTRKLFDLFKALHNVPDPAEVVRLAALHEVDFLPPPNA
ncbi:cupin domain-containing protein [Phreatobacter stygius]|uniref:Cupin domain-containing protein n=1 Tax=Phreatobacter stygius TaxID=1940610 RepID=A0A4D7BL68_9HYPH|nr:cupin domain-containing protein [Phreatobacter stygius]QCI68477.1 cupin domain-containing protein [Phreatobacter stygius]